MTSRCERCECDLCDDCGASCGACGEHVLRRLLGDVHGLWDGVLRGVSAPVFELATRTFARSVSMNGLCHRCCEQADEERRRQQEEDAEANRRRYRRRRGGPRCGSRRRVGEAGVPA